MSQLPFQAHTWACSRCGGHVDVKVANTEQRIDPMGGKLPWCLHQLGTGGAMLESWKQPAPSHHPPVKHFSERCKAQLSIASGPHWPLPTSGNSSLARQLRLGLGCGRGTA